jgi:hypothetical protein
MATLPSTPPGPERQPSTGPNEDPIDNAVHLWVLRLWIVCALLCLGYAVANYLLNHFAR